MTSNEFIVTGLKMPSSSRFRSLQHCTMYVKHTEATQSHGINAWCESLQHILYRRQGIT